jgi:hypothetical protein
MQNQKNIEDELGEDHTFLYDVSLRRKPESTGEYREHERSLRFHRALPWLLAILWIAFGGFAVALFALNREAGL